MKKLYTYTLLFTVLLMVFLLTGFHFTKDKISFVKHEVGKEIKEEIKEETMNYVLPQEMSEQKLSVEVVPETVNEPKQDENEALILEADEEEGMEEDYEYLTQKQNVEQIIEEARLVKDFNKAYVAVYESWKDYPDDEYFNELKSYFISCMPTGVDENNILSKESCRVENEWFADQHGNNQNADFRINFGGGNLILNLEGEYKYLDLKALLSASAPTKAHLNIAIYGDSNLLYSYNDFNTTIGEIHPVIDVSGVERLEISCIENTYEWVGEASFSKPDAECHFFLRIYREKSLEWFDLEESK